jgi:CRP-like cAMP-binding protein
MDFPNLTSLLQGGTFYRRLKGQTLQTFERPTVSIIAKGYVKRYLIAKDGTVSVQSIYGPGYFFPLTTAFLALFEQRLSSGDETYYYEAVTDVEYYSLSVEQFALAAQQNPLIYKEMLYEAGRRLQSNIQQLENMALKNAYRRVAHLLVYFAMLYGQKAAGGTQLVVPLTHQDIGDMLDLSRETVSREIAKLKTRGLIATDKTIVIPDINALKAIYT